MIVLRHIPNIREDGMKVAVMEVISKNTIWAAPWGICIIRALRSLKPNPAVIIDVNYNRISFEL